MFALPARPRSRHTVDLYQGRSLAQQFFQKFASNASTVVGSAWTFIAAAALIVAWIVTGPFFGFSDTWQLVINTTTTIVTFLMVFLLQNTQNRDAKAIHLKLDELIRGSEGARTGLVDLEDLSDAELDRLQKQFEQIRQQDNGNGAASVNDGIKAKIREELEKRRTA